MSYMQLSEGGFQLVYPLLPWTLCFPPDRQRCPCSCELAAHGGFVLTAASTPSADCDALCVHGLGGHPPVERVHVGASLCTCDMCALNYLTRLGV